MFEVFPRPTFIPEVTWADRFANQLRRARFNVKLTPRMAVEQLWTAGVKLSCEQLEDMETAKTCPTVWELERIAEVYHTTIVKLVEV